MLYNGGKRCLAQCLAQIGAEVFGGERKGANEREEEGGRGQDLL